MSGQDDLKIFFGERIKECMDSLYTTACRMTGNSADAEDLVSDSVIKAWQSIHSLEDKSRFRPWLFRIMHNGFISRYRKKSIRPVESSYDEHPDEQDEFEVTSLLIEQSDDFLLWWGNPEREFINTLMGEEIMKAIGTLPEAFRTTVILINVEGFSYDEAAEILNVPEGTIRSRMKRGRTLLQKILWEHAKDAGLVTGDREKECQV